MFPKDRLKSILLGMFILKIFYSCELELFQFSYLHLP